MTSEASFSGPVDLLVFGIDRKLVSSCTTSSIAILSMSYFLASRLAAEKLCKVTSNFWTGQIFRRFFLNFSIFGGVSPFQGRPGTSVPKSECKVRRSPRTSQIFRQVFSRKFQPEEGQSTVATGGQGIGRGGEKDGQWRSPAALSPPCGQTPNCMEGTGSFESAFFFDQEEFFLGGWESNGWVDALKRVSGFFRWAEGDVKSIEWPVWT